MNRGFPLSVPLAFGWTLASAYALSSLVTLGISIRPSAMTDVVQLGAIEALVFVVGVFGVLRVHAGDGPLGPALGLRPTHPLLLALALLLGCSVHYPAESIDAIVQRFLPDSPAELAEQAALLSAPTPLRLVLVIFVIACIGPLVEELFFRGALFGALRHRHSATLTTSVISLCFVLGHLNVRRWPALLAVAVALTYVRSVSGSLLPALALHVAFNALTVLSYATGDVPLDEHPKLAAVSTFAGWGATLALVLAIRYVASHAALARRGRAEDAQ